MKFNLETSSANLIRGYEPGQVKIQQYSRETHAPAAMPSLKTLTRSFIITASDLIEDWEVDDQLLTISMLDKVLATQPDVILLGTGEKARFPSHEIIQACHTVGAGIEIMNSSAACRTFNILVSELRNVTAAFTKV
jgi:uncharacterized protein